MPVLDSWGQPISSYGSANPSDLGAYLQDIRTNFHPGTGTNNTTGLGWGFPGGDLSDYLQYLDAFGTLDVLQNGQWVPGKDSQMDKFRQWISGMVTDDKPDDQHLNFSGASTSYGELRDWLADGVIDNPVTHNHGSSPTTPSIGQALQPLSGGADPAGVRGPAGGTPTPKPPVPPRAGGTTDAVGLGPLAVIAALAGGGGGGQQPLPDPFRSFQTQPVQPIQSVFAQGPTRTMLRR